MNLLGTPFFFFFTCIVGGLFMLHLTLQGHSDKNKLAVLSVVHPLIDVSLSHMAICMELVL